ncbi:MAG: hypothetical protein IJC58_03140, partial [Oscillospiraceae bacterium]|nr:hypothetical protein [Oscillospiraceae bacterium]
MKKFLALLLTLALCVGLVPAALAEGSAPATGVYFALDENGRPTGTHVDLTEGTLNGKTFEGYWGLTYTAGQPFTFYYYDAAAPEGSMLVLDDGQANLDARNAGGFDAVSITPVGESGKLWQVSFTATRSAEFNMVFRCQTETGGYDFLAFFASQASSSPTAKTGIYLDAENGAPKGDAIEGSRPEGNGPWGYWNIPYDSSCEKVIYYYDPDAAFFSLAGKPDGLYVYIEEAGDHFWKVTLRAPQAGFGSFEMFFDTCSDGGFPVSFADTFEPTYEVGLYYRPLWVEEGPGIDVPRVSESNGFFTNYPIILPPYVNRTDAAFYFYDGTEFTPVEVTATKGLSIDLFDVSRHTDRYDGADGKTGWYMIMAYDFTVGHLEYRHTDGNTYKIQFKSNFLPDFAFYAHDAASTDHYRMYQVMDPCTDGEYKYRTTLYLKSSDPDFNSFTADENDLIVSCGQQLYDEYGFMVDWVDSQGNGHYLKPMERGTDYDYALELSADGKTLTVTLWANESDLNFRIDKEDENTRWQWGAYVNLLAADESSPLAFNLANQGAFESAKFMPVHLFKQLAGKSIRLTQPGYSGSLTLDGDAVNTVIANSVDTYNQETGEGTITAVSLSMASHDGATNAQDTAIDTLVGVDTRPLMTLEFGTSLPEGKLGGNATVSHVLSDDAIPAGTEVA